jgi:hypothetical protein
MKDSNITILIYIFIFMLFQIRDNNKALKFISFISFIFGSIYFTYTYYSRSSKYDLQFGAFIVLITCMTVIVYLKDRFSTRKQDENKK